MKLVVKGERELLAKLKNLGGAGAKRAARKAVNAGTQPMLKAVRAAAPVETGALKKAMAKKITGKGFNVNGIVGADANYVGDDGRKPVKYDHLVEYGHKGPDGTVPPHPFIRSGYDVSVAAAREKYAEKLASEIEAEAEKAAQGGK